MSAEPQQSSGKRRLVLAVLVAALAGAGFYGWSLLERSNRGQVDLRRTTGLSTTAPIRPKVAVLYFDNLSGDEELEWLRSGLTDMLVTDLSQSPDIRVLPTDRLYQILADMRKLDERITSFEVIQEIANRANADTIVLGSFDKDGDTIRISITIQEAATGEVLRAESVDARMEEDIFSRIDDLSRGIRLHVAKPGQVASVADRDLTEVSTTSLEAYRFFVEGEMLHIALKDDEAVDFYHKAVATDPQFAMAWAKLATAYGNQGFLEESRRYAGEALKLLDRLTAPERAYVEGRFYGQKVETQARAIAIYSEALARYPHLTSLSNNLGLLYQNHWMFDEAIETLEHGIRYGDIFPGTYDALSAAHLRLGETELAFQVMDDFLERYPRSFSAYSSISDLQISLGNVEEAKKAIQQAEELRSGYFPLNFGRYAIAVIERNWEASEQVLAVIGDLPLPFARGAELGLRANNLIFQGRSEEALALLQPALDSIPGRGPGRAQVQLTGALAHLELEEPAIALEYARAAREEAPGEDPDFGGLAVEILAYQGLGRQEEAELALQELTRRTGEIPGYRMASLLHEVRGRLAMARGETDTAVEELELAAENLPHLDGNNPRVWYALGEAYLQAGELEKAESLFREIVQLAGPHVFSPTEFVMSHYQLGVIYEALGDRVQAGEFYGRFLDFWAEGDLRREEVETARRFIDSL